MPFANIKGHHYSLLDSEVLEKQGLNSEASNYDGYISQLDKDGNIEQVPVKYDSHTDKPVVLTSPTRSVLDVDDSAGATNSMADFVSSDILTKPFNFVSGNVSKARFNPFRKKSGLLNVLAKQATRNRIVAKNGVLNTMSSTDGKTHHFLKVDRLFVYCCTFYITTNQALEDISSHCG